MLIHTRSVSYRRLLGVLCIAGAIALLTFSAPASAQAANASVSFTSSGGADDLQPPPAASCNDLVFLNNISLNENGVPIGAPRLGVGPGLVISFEVPDFTPLGPSQVTLNEVITYDGHAGRDTATAQLNEQVRLEFLLNGEVQATTPFTPDVEDNRLSAWTEVSLGSYDLPNGADGLRVVHYNNPPKTDSVVISAICGTSTELPAPTTTTVAADDQTIDCDVAGDNDSSDPTGEAVDPTCNSPECDDDAATGAVDADGTPCNPPCGDDAGADLSLIHISEPTRPY